tara:strand:+ start:201 stop:419 length:219 start_codon:yes stop_codon:yes gene_type:complete
MKKMTSNTLLALTTTFLFALTSAAGAWASTATPVHCGTCGAGGGDGDQEHKDEKKDEKKKDEKKEEKKEDKK